MVQQHAAGHVLPCWALSKAFSYFALFSTFWRSLVLCLQRGQKCEQSNNFWENYEEDIARVASLRSTVFRLSLGAANSVRAPAALRMAYLWCLHCLPIVKSLLGSGEQRALQIESLRGRLHM